MKEAEDIRKQEEQRMFLTKLLELAVVTDDSIGLIGVAVRKKRELRDLRCAGKSKTSEMA